MTAELTGRQAAALASRSDVISVVRDELSHPDTTYSPSFLGLDAPGGLWEQLGGAEQAGAGVGVGVGNGHGAHTASTAAGNNGTTVTIDGNLIGTGSGMAPGAKVAAYKVCWEARPNGDAGCFNSDSVAAINQAVLDGVDVLNYSIGGTTESDVLDPVAQAFRGASNAGVFVANSAGNSGPGASTLDHPAPWVTRVAAATFRRAFQAVELGNGQRYVGASITPSLPTLTPFVTSLSVKLASASDSDAAICASGTLDPAKAAGKIVPLTPAELAAAPQVPEIADFSSRGPSPTTDGDILKPDIAAPGVDVVAAVAPPINHGRSWDFLSGTSMASPHIAGIGAPDHGQASGLDAVGDQVLYGPLPTSTASTWSASVWSSPRRSTRSPR